MIEREQDLARGIAHARAALEAGQLVLLPTETVAGLAARADDAQAVARIFTAKGRAQDKPLAVCVRDADAAEALAELCALSRALMDVHWPGPLTIVLPAKDYGLAPECLGANGTTVALRCPDVVWRDALCFAPLALTSANLSGQPSVTDVARARADFSGVVAVPGGGDPSGQPSTIVSVMDGAITTLRAGQIVIGSAP